MLPELNGPLCHGGGEGEAWPTQAPPTPLPSFPPGTPPPFPELTMANRRAPGPPAACAACFHTQATLRPANTPKAAAAISQRPQPWPRPVPGRACPADSLGREQGGGQPEAALLCWNHTQTEAWKARFLDSWRILWNWTFWFPYTVLPRFPQGPVQTSIRAS